MTGGGARAPVETGYGGCLDLERIHESDDVLRDGRLLGVADGGLEEEGGGAGAA